MPMLQYNGPTYGYNPYQTYLPQSPWQGPQPYMQPQMAQSPVQQVQTQASQSLVGHIVTANDQIPVSEVPQNGAPASQGLSWTSLRKQITTNKTTQGGTLMFASNNLSAADVAKESLTKWSTTLTV